MKNEKTNLIIWAVVVLVIGVIIGYFLTSQLSTTGNAKMVTKELNKEQYTALVQCTNPDTTEINVDCLKKTNETGSAGYSSDNATYDMLLKDCSCGRTCISCVACCGHLK